ncbi:hypothetical protein A2V68_01560, partial [candidate division Kazan bacterium RBG_13_50_9]
AFLSLLLYYLVKRPKLRLDLTRSEIYSLVLSGVVGFVAAPLFSVVGLRYITGTTAGLFAGLSAILVMVLGFIILREKPRNVQLVGSLIALAGVYVFLSNGVWGGSLFGITMIALAELSYAFSTVLTRLVVRGPGDETMITSLVGAGIGTAILLPVGFLSGGMAGVLQWQALVTVLVVGVIFGFAGMMWSAVLDQLQAIEAAILQNTMLIQIALLAIIFLREHITLNNVVGGVAVVFGAYLVDSGSIRRGQYAKSPT